MAEPLDVSMGGQLGGSMADLVSNIKNCAINLSALNSTIQTSVALIQTTSLALQTAVMSISTAIMSTFPRINGTFTLSAATTTVVSQGSIAANSIVIPFATNATAALIVRTNGLFHLSNQPTTSFTMSTQSGSATSGGTFEYIVFNPS